MNKSISLPNDSLICRDVLKALNLRHNWWSIVSELEKEGQRARELGDGSEELDIGIWIIVSHTVLPRFKRMRADRSTVKTVGHIIKRAFFSYGGEPYKLTIECLDTVSNVSVLVTMNMELAERGELILANAVAVDPPTLLQEWITKQAVGTALKKL